MTNPAPQLPPWFPRDPSATRTPDPAPQPREPKIATVIANAGGVAIATLGPVEPGAVWLVDYVIVTSTSAAASSVNLYDDPAATPVALLDGTANGNSAVAAYVPPRYLYGSRSLVAVWSGCTPGASCTLRLEYRHLLQD